MKRLLPLFRILAWFHVNLFTPAVWRARLPVWSATLKLARLRVTLFYVRHLKP